MPRPKLSNIPTEALIREIERRQAKAEQLKAQRDKLNKEIAELAGATQIAATPAPAGRKPGRKPAQAPGAARGGAKPLRQYLQEVLAGATNGLTLPEIQQAVLAAGYPTTAKTLYNPILKIFRSDKSFTKIDRGIYALKSAATGKPGPKPGRKPGKKTAKKPAAPKAKKTVKRKKYAVTADQFILGLAKGDGATTGAINKAWKDAGRTGRADNTLNKMVKAGKLKRKNIEGQRGSVYTAA